MTSIRQFIQRYYISAKPLPVGIYHYQAPPNAPKPYRLHLRLESDGNGLLIFNASTVLHLNQSAAEIAYHIVNNSTVEEAARQISGRYRVSKTRAANDFRALKERIETLIDTPDLDPEMYLDFKRIPPASGTLSAPYRLDCALTYRSGEVIDFAIAAEKLNKHELSTSEWISILDKAWKAGIPHVVFTGGEPTLREDLKDLLAHAEENGQVTGLITDGLYFIDQDKLNLFLQTGLDHIVVNLKPEAAGIWAALENLASADLFVTVHLTITLQNALGVSDTIRKVAQQGIKSLSLSTNDINLQNTLIDQRNYAASLNMSLIWNLPVPYSAFNPISLETQEESSSQESCPTSLYVEPDGDVVPAQGINLVLGNLLADPWEKIWQ
jgi:organic radical activating enzyme